MAKPLPLAHTYPPDQLFEAMQAEPFDVRAWEAARSSSIPMELAAQMRATLLWARFVLVPPAQLHQGVSEERSFADITAKARYGVSFLEGFKPEILPRRVMEGAMTCPSLALTLPLRETDAFTVYPGFLREMSGTAYFWDGTKYWELRDPALTGLLYWKKA